MSYAVLCNYENYYNRRCLPPKRLVDDYRDYIIHVTPSSINFNPNDGINAELVVNWDGEHPNYLLINEIGGLVASRWYVLEATHLRSGQLRLSLRRDLFADYYDDVLYAPAMIERGRLPLSDPYIYNDESVAFNQIKQKETLLKDETGCAWLVGYMDTSTAKSVVVPSATPVQADYSWSGSLDTWYYSYLPIQSIEDTAIGYRIDAGSVESPTTSYITDFLVDANGNTSFTSFTTTNPVGIYATETESQVATAITRTMADRKEFLDATAKADFLPSISDFNNQALLPYLRMYDGKLLQTSDGLWRMKLVQDENYSSSYSVTDESSTMFAAMADFCERTRAIGGTPNDFSFAVRAIGKAYRLEFEEYTSSTSYTIPISGQRRRVSDAPYSIFAIPFGDLTIDYGTNSSMLSDKWAGLSAAIYLAQELTDSLYDLQILPYCPIREFVRSAAIDIKKGIAGVDYDIITTPLSGNETSPTSMIFWASSSQFSFNINYLEISEYDLKVTNQCVTRRLCSPNYSAIYEFNEAKSNGIGGFAVDCAYKPFSPYIHVWPKGGINSLYGEDFNDPRGLICSGDFSVTRVIDQWAQYELNNKNFQNMFDRQIETMELTHNVQRSEQIVNMLVSSVGAGATGAGGASMVGLGSGGMTVAGIASTALSVGAGIADIAIQDKLRENERDQAGDMFLMSNENIQARPDTLTKVSAFNPNNKLFPVLETYAPTDKEIKAFQDYLKYHGMKVGRIGTVAEFVWPTEEWVQGRILRFQDLADDAHIAFEINNELMKGVYLSQ